MDHFYVLLRGRVREKRSECMRNNNETITTQVLEIIRKN